MEIIQRFLSWYSDTFRKQKFVGKAAIGCVSLLVLGCLCSVPIGLLSPKLATSKTAEVVPADVSGIQTAAAETVIAGVTENAPTDTPVPTDRPAPTDTPAPTETPLPPTTTPEPIIFTGTGDSIVDFVNPFQLAIVHITGNGQSHHFAVKNYNSNGETIDLLVNTTDPYDGIRPLDFRNDEHTARFEVNATGEWKIEVLPISSARVMAVPGIIEGQGDEVILLKGAKPDLAKIKGNSESRHFAVHAYGNFSDLLVNTTDPYDGTVIVNEDVVVLEITATGIWSIELTAR